MKLAFIGSVDDYLQERREGGFTLMEMLIVVAIIAVLIAIAIPVFTSQLEKSRESTDAANLRAGYATVMMKAMDDPKTSIAAASSLGTKFKGQQGTAGWQNSEIAQNLKNLAVSDSAMVVSVDIDSNTAGGDLEITYTPGDAGNAPKILLKAK